MWKTTGRFTNPTVGTEREEPGGITRSVVARVPDPLASPPTQVKGPLNQRRAATMYMNVGEEERSRLLRELYGEARRVARERRATRRAPGHRRPLRSLSRSRRRGRGGIRRGRGRALEPVGR